jgi:hypothetical protein
MVENSVNYDIKGRFDTIANLMQNTKKLFVWAGSSIETFGTHEEADRQTDRQLALLTAQ